MASGDDSIRNLDILLLGKAGSGKSRTGNSILGKKNTFVFGEPTVICNAKQCVRFGKNLNVIDTPSILDQDNLQSIIQFIDKGNKNENFPICVICVQIGRFSDEDLQTYTRYTELFTDAFFKFSIVVFTNGDQWENDMKDKCIQHPNFDDYIKNLSDQCKTLLKRCGDRYVMFNNRTEGEENDAQVERCLTIVEQMVNNNSKETDQIESAGIWRSVVSTAKYAKTKLTKLFNYITSNNNIDGISHQRVSDSSDNGQGN